MPNPLTIQGLAQQGAIRAEDMGVTVRDRTEIETEEGDFITTLTMQDGSKQVITGEFTGLDAHVGRGGSIPMLTAESVQHAGTTAKFAGPALGLAGAVYNVFAAETATQACVGGISGVFAVGGDYLGGQAGVWAAGWAGLATGPAAPVMVPLFAITGALGGQYALGSMGTTIGEAICQ